MDKYLLDRRQFSSSLCRNQRRCLPLPHGSRRHKRARRRGHGEHRLGAGP